MATITEEARTAKSFDFAQDLTKLLITLATGIVTITITFLKEVASKAPASAHKWIEIAWLLYLLSIVGGILALMAMTSALDEDTSPSINKRDITCSAMAQFILFGAAIALTIVFGMQAL